jgi:hypothetical protein
VYQVAQSHPIPDIALSPYDVPNVSGARHIRQVPVQSEALRSYPA